MVLIPLGIKHAGRFRVSDHLLAYHDLCLSSESDLEGKEEPNPISCPRPQPLPEVWTHQPGDPRGRETGDLQGQLCILWRMWLLHTNVLSFPEQEVVSINTVRALLQSLATYRFCFVCKCRKTFLCVCRLTFKDKTEARKGFFFFSAWLNFGPQFADTQRECKSSDVFARFVCTTGNAQGLPFFLLWESSLLPPPLSVELAET